jgi:hypothetical protein
MMGPFKNIGVYQRWILDLRSAVRDSYSSFLITTPEQLSKPPKDKATGGAPYSTMRVEFFSTNLEWNRG